MGGWKKVSYKPATPMALAPNITSATCSVSLIRWSNTTVPVFSGSITLPGSLGTLKVIEVWVVLSTAKRVRVARYDSGFIAGGTFSYSGYDPQILTTSATQNVAVEFDCYNTEFTPTSSPYTITPVVIPASGITSFSVTDNVSARWSVKGGPSPLQAVTPNTISCSSYPQVVTIWSVSPQYGRIWHKWYEIDTVSTVINIGAQGSDTSIFPPTVGTSEVVRFWAAIGAYGSEVDPTTITGAVFYDVTISGPATPINTDAHGFYITTSNPTYAAGPDGAPRRKFGWQIQGYLPITASDTPDRFWSMRMCIETRNGAGTLGGQRPNAMDPTDKRTVVGDYAGPTAWYSDEDHDVGIKGDPATGLITWDNPNLWDVPVDGYNHFRYSIWIQSRRNGGTWVQMATWSAAPGTSTPGTNLYQEQVVDDTQTRLTELSINTASGFVVKVDSTTNGVEVDGAPGVKSIYGAGSLALQTAVGVGLTLTPTLLSSTGANLDAQVNTLEVNNKFNVNSNGIPTKIANIPTDLTTLGVGAIIATNSVSNASTNQTLLLQPGGSAAPQGVYEVGIVLGASVTDGSNSADVTANIGFNSILDSYGTSGQAIAGLAQAYPGTGAPVSNKLACGILTTTGEAWPRIFFPPFVIYHRGGGADISVSFSVSGTWTTARYSAIAYLKRIA